MVLYGSGEAFWVFSGVDDGVIILLNEIPDQVKMDVGAHISKHNVKRSTAVETR